MEIESHFQAYRLISTIGCRNSLPTEIGSHTNRTSRDALRFTSGHLLARKARLEANCQFPPMAALKCAGGATARNCSISRWMGGSCRFRSTLLQTVKLLNPASLYRFSPRV